MDRVRWVGGKIQLAIRSISRVILIFFFYPGFPSMAPEWVEHAPHTSDFRWFFVRV